MRNRDILKARAAAQVAPALWAFAYPVRGRSFQLARRLALVLWVQLLRVELLRRDLL
jgi:hypothetical protein